MSRSNFSNCKNPDAVVQCAVRIDRASPEGGEGQARCTCRLHEQRERRDREREREREIGGEQGIRCRSHGSDADTKTKPRQGEAGEVQVPVRRKSNTQVAAPLSPIPLLPSFPQRTAIQRANDSLTRDIFGWQIRWEEEEAEADSVLAITSTITTHGAAGRRRRVGACGVAGVETRTESSSTSSSIVKCRQGAVKCRQNDGSKDRMRMRMRKMVGK